MPMLPLIATAADLVSLGYPPVSDDLLARASARVRGYTRQQITPGTSTVVLRGSGNRLPQRPVVDIVSVTDRDGNNVAWDLGTASLVYPERRSPVEVTYSHGFDPIPDELVDLVCSIATRLANTPDAVSAGATSEQAGGESIAWGADAYGGTSSLTSAEKKALDRLFPKIPRTVSLL